MYERERQLTELLRRALDTVREEAGRAVAEAIGTAVPPAVDLEAIVRRVVREEGASAASGDAWMASVRRVVREETERTAGVVASVASVVPGREDDPPRTGPKAAGEPADKRERHGLGGRHLAWSLLAVALLGVGWVGRDLVDPWLDAAGPGNVPGVPADTTARPEDTLTRSDTTARPPRRNGDALDAQSDGTPTDAPTDTTPDIDLDILDLEISAEAVP